jgi:hypothetical protein
MSANISVAAVFKSTGSTDYNAASSWINAVASEYSTYFGTPSGGVTTGTDANGTYYVQWFANGKAILAYSDGYVYFYSGTGGWNSLGVVWNVTYVATSWINMVASEYPAYFGTKAGGVITETDSFGGSTYYIQWFTNGTAIMAYSADGRMYFYDGIGSSWYPLGIRWR